MPQIKTVTLAGGRKRYRFVIDLPHAPGEKRRQETHTFTSLTEARAELSRLGYQKGTGEYAGRWNGTVSELIDRYLRHADDGAEENTKVSYRLALAPARDRLGAMRARDVDREQIQDLKEWMETRGRKRGGKPGTGVGPRSVRLTMGRLSAAYELAIIDRKLNYNPVRYVKLPKLDKREPDTWQAAEVRAFLAEAAQDRLSAAWRLTMYGLRREEVLGLRWDDRRLPPWTPRSQRPKGSAAADLEHRLVTIGNARVLAGGEVIEKGPKSDNGYRTLPLDDVLVAALQALRDRQVTEAMEAGDAYEDSGYVVADELGRPVHPDWYSDEFHRVRERAGLRRITLRNARHTANSWMADLHVAPHVRAAWCGHTQAVNVSVYTAAADLSSAAEAMAALGTLGDGCETA